MDQGIKLRVGKGTAKDFKAFLAPAHAGQPVVHKCNPEPGQLRRNFELRIRVPARRRPPAGRRGRIRRFQNEPDAPMPRMRASMPASSVKLDRQEIPCWTAIESDNVPKFARSGKAGCVKCLSRVRDRVRRP